MSTLRTPITIALATGALSLAFAGGTASAHDGATCSGALGSGIVVHGQHIVGDYVTGLGGIFGGGLEWPPAGQVGAAVKENG